VELAAVPLRRFAVGGLDEGNAQRVRVSEHLCLVGTQIARP
jgi:hypothetical protein